jgi:hypothetical protein
MSIHTSIDLLNSKDPEFIKATTGTPEQLEEWEDDNGPVADRPGVRLDDSNNEWLEETEDEYGGWVIDISKLPPEATHILITRG